MKEAEDVNVSVEDDNVSVEGDNVGVEAGEVHDELSFDDSEYELYNYDSALEAAFEDSFGR